MTIQSIAKYYSNLVFNSGLMISPHSFFLVLAGLLLSLNHQINAQTQPEVRVPFVLNNEHIIIPISLNSSDPLNFIFDSGAGGTLISKKTADSLEFKSKRSRTNIGVSGAHKVEAIRGVDLSLVGKKVGNITLLSSNTYFEEMDDGRKVNGVIGFAILSRYVVEIDYARQELLLFNRLNYQYSGNGKALTISIEQNLPMVQASIKLYNGTQFEGRFMVDTGSRTDIIISSPTVIKYDVAENIGNYYNVRASIGTSTRRTKMRYGRLQSLIIGGYKFDNIPVALSSDNKGVLSLESLNGIIGNRLLQRFDVIFDYQRSVMYLEPSVLIGADYEVNRSGFNINFVEGKPFIKNLIDRSPADLAGLRNDDEIVSINGVLVEELSPEEIRDSFIKENERIEIVIRRNNKFKYTEFTLKPLI